MERKLREELKLEKERKTKVQSRNTGITLIALIITIIVLLILAGVTINLTLGEKGIFRTAEMAGKNYMDAQDRELAGLIDFENTINNIIGGTGSSSGTDTPDAPGTTYETLASVAEPGDYVKYDTGINSVGENGVVTFRVLYNDDTYGLQIISDKNVEQVTLGTAGKDDLTAFQASMNDYNNAIAILNERAEYYATSSQYALDGRCIGSVATIGVDGKFNAKNTEVEGTYSIPDGWTLPTGWTSRDTGCQKWRDTNYSTDQTAMQTANILTTGAYYWLASRAADSNLSYCYFLVRSIDTSGRLNSYGLCDVNSAGNNSYRYGIGLRPCISLKADIKVVAGDGETEETAYELGI